MPEPLSATELMFIKATVFAKKDPRTDNTGIVHLGCTSGEDTQEYDLSPGDIIQLDALGRPMDFRDWWLDVETADDGLCIQFT